MTSNELFELLKADKIQIDAKGHYVKHVVRSIEWKVQHTRDMVKKYQDMVDRGVKDKDKSDPKNMLDWYSRDLNDEIEFGRPIRLFEAVQCGYCDARLYLMLMEDGTLTVVDTHVYWDLAEKHAEEVGDKNAKYDYHITYDKIPVCKANDLLQAKKMVSRINVPSGKMIFQNFFRKDELYDFPDDYPLDYSEQSINAITGRNNLMQYLATQNVGYGQMGNMSVGVWTNGKDEILVTDAYMEEFEDAVEWMEQNPKDYTAEDIQREKDKVAYYENKLAEIEGAGFKKKGTISLSVWRWMCADKQVLEEAGEDLNVDEYTDQVEFKVKPGLWEIEHYFDFTRIGDFGEDFDDPIFSRLKLVEPLKKERKKKS